MSSQKIGPSSLASRVRCCTGAVESSDSMLPTTGLVGGCGIGLSLLTDGMLDCSLLSRLTLPVILRSRALARRLEGWPLAPALVSASFEARPEEGRAPQDDGSGIIHPNRFLRHSMIFALTSSGFSCCVQWPLSRTRYFSRSGMIFSMPSAADGGSTASFSAMIISDGTRTVGSMSAERCQLRDMLRYQLMPPVKPVRLKVSTNTFFSSDERIGARVSYFTS